MVIKLRGWHGRTFNPRSNEIPPEDTIFCVFNRHAIQELYNPPTTGEKCEFYTDIYNM